MGQAAQKKSTHVSFDSEKAVIAEARKVILQAGIKGQLPTPVDEILRSVDLEVDSTTALDFFREKFNELKDKGSKIGRIINVVAKKIRGATDLDEKVIYVPKDAGKKPRRNFIALHETAHQHLKWHKIGLRYTEDDDDTLSTDFSDRYEWEANVFAENVLYQIDLFELMAFDNDFNIAVPLNLAGDFGASKQSSLKRYVKKSPYPCGLITFEANGQNPHDWDVRWVDYSEPFRKKYGDIDWAGLMDTTLAMELNAAPQGRVSIPFVWTIEYGNLVLPVTCEIYNNAYRRLMLIRPEKLSVISGAYTIAKSIITQ